MVTEQSNLIRRSNTPQHQTYESLGSPTRRPKKVISTNRSTVSETASSSAMKKTPSSIFSEESNSQVSQEEPLKDLSWSEKLQYYLPCYSWIPTYNSAKFIGDLAAGLSLASFQIPLALSYATSVAHVPALCGLYSLAIPPMIYAIFGSVPQMIVGPEGAISLVIGQAVEPLVSHNPKLDPVDLVSVLSCIGGFYLLGAGICRFGFLDNVLSRALLRGFISAVGLVMIINSLYDELGVYISGTDVPSHFHSPAAKIWYLIRHINYIHKPTVWISLASFVFLYTFGLVKKIFIARGKKNWVFIPEILLVVVVSTILSGIYDWPSTGVKIVGKIHTKGFTYKSPFASETLPLYHTLMTSGLLAATLGFFESTTASKSLGSTYDLPISSNRELVALGAINLFGGFLGALPAFGGYGRSKINALSGAKTTLSGFIMGLVTLVTIFYLLKYIYYLPICVLSVITSIVGLKLLDETPSDLLFHIRAKGYSELVTFCITLLATLFYSMEAGILLGVVYSVILVIKNSTKSRIQILGRLPGTNRFFNADEPLPADSGDLLEEIEGCLIVKITEPLTFSNTSDLKLRLLRIERYGSVKTHPAAPRVREDYMNKHVLFDLNGLTYLDSSSAQILIEILSGYIERNIKIYFIRVPTKHGIRERLRNSGIEELLKFRYYSSIDEVLQLIDLEEPERVPDALAGTDESV